MKNILFVVLFAFLMVFPLNKTQAVSNTIINNDDIITLYTEINDNTAKFIINRLNKLSEDKKNNKPILFYINSIGGDISAGIRIINAMMVSRRPVYTINVGIAASMSAYIFSHGKLRIMLPNTTLMFHHASISISGDIESVTGRILDIRDTMERLDRYVCDRSGYNYNMYRFKISNEWWIDMKQASELGFVDSVTLIQFPAE